MAAQDLTGQIKIAVSAIAGTTFLVACRYESLKQQLMAAQSLAEQSETMTLPVNAMLGNTFWVPADMRI